MAKSLLTYDQLACELDVKPSTIRTWVRKGRIPAVRVTAQVVRFDLNDVVAALKNGCLPPKVVRKRVAK